MLKRALEIRGYNVIEAADGLETLAIVKKLCPNLIVIDLNMPGLDGLETVRHIRELKGPCKKVPIIAITAFDVYGMEDAALETGCDQYLSKPFDLADLDRALRGLGFVV